jgi:hypothetical protein
MLKYQSKEILQSRQFRDCAALNSGLGFFCLQTIPKHIVMLALLAFTGARSRLAGEASLWSGGLDVSNCTCNAPANEHQKRRNPTRQEFESERYWQVWQMLP